MNITAINDADRERHFDNFNDKLLKRVRAIKQNKSYDRGLHSSALHGAKRNINRKGV